MREAISLAAKGLGRVSPNPPVGCVIVKDGAIIGRGWHKVYGGPHAEPNALQNAGSEANGATAYVTLTPCNHYGKTPPCTKALIDAGIKRVVVAVDDPDATSGDGKETLLQAGIKVEVGVLQAEAEWSMHGFIKYITEKLPHVHLKYAMTMDGKIATNEGDSKWISSEKSRSHVQDLRRISDAVMVGSATAIQDNPSLNIREGDTSIQPVRVVVDSKLLCSGKLTDNSALFKNAGGKIVFLSGEKKSSLPAQKLISMGAEILEIPRYGQHLNLHEGLQILAHEYGVRNILCEGGAGLAGALIQSQLIDEVSAFVCPKILGGSGLSPFEGPAKREMSDAFRLTDITFRQFDQDLLVNGKTLY